MRAIKAVYQNGQIAFTEPAPEADPEALEVMVIFPETGDEAWERIINDPRPRPALEQLVREVEQEIAEGKAEPLDDAAFERADREIAEAAAKTRAPDAC